MEAHAAIVESAIPFVVAFTKMDKNGADLTKAQSSVLEHGIYLEGLGGDVPYAGVSSKSGEGVPELLDLVLLTADMAELSADATQPATGFVLESSQDPKRGISATLIVKDGTLATGTFAVAGGAMTPVRFIENFAGARIPSAGPSQPIRISGWDMLPPAGTPFVSVPSKKEAEKLTAEGATPKSTVVESFGDKTILPLIIKADVSGSIEAIKHELAKITHERAAIRIVGEGIGAVAENDVKQAAAGGATVVAFTVGTESSARDLAERMNVSIESFQIIYDLNDRMTELLTARAPEITVEEVTGEAKILRMFNATGNKKVLGANLLTGAIKLGDQVKLTRRGIDLGYGKVVNLQQARADVKEIKTEGEFGAQIETKADIAQGDTITPFGLVTK
jgi:translation initiation factor IF-2